MQTKRLQYFALLVILGGLGLSAYGQREGDANPPAGGAVTAGNLRGGLDDVVKATGFAKHMPKSTHLYLGVYDGKGFIERLRRSKIVTWIERQAAEHANFHLDELQEKPGLEMVFSLLGEEIFLGMGAGSPEQLAVLLDINEAVNLHSMKLMVKSFDAWHAEEPPDPESMVESTFGLAASNWLADERVGLRALENAALPPIMLGFKVSDEALRAQMLAVATGALMQGLEEIGPEGKDFAEGVQVRRGDAEFSGFRLMGQKLAAKIGPEMKEEMVGVLGAATVEKLIEVLESKNIVVAVGTRDDYLIGFVGADIEQLKFAASPEDSVLVRPEMDFMKSYADKELLIVGSASKQLQDSLAKHTTLLRNAAIGLKEGLAETEAFGDTRDLEALLQVVAERESALFDMSRYTPASVVVYLEDGLKVESYGGSNMPGYDLDAPRQYASLGMADDVFLFANWIANPAFTEKALDYVDSIGQTAYLGAKHLANMEELSGWIGTEFVEGFAMFDERLRPHLLALWTGLRKDLVAGLGSEGAIIMDLKGELPTVPGLPQVIVDEGKAPRFSFLVPIEDRARLKASWEHINGALRGILKLVSEFSGFHIPMQKPMSSEKGDLKTWFLPMLFQTDDFVFNITLGKDFYASTSKSFVQGLARKLEEAVVDESHKGTYFSMNLALLNAYLNEWLQLVEDHAADIFEPDSPYAEDFEEVLPMVKEMVEALSELKGIEGRMWKADGTIRSSFHFQTGN